MIKKLSIVFIFHLAFSPSIFAAGWSPSNGRVLDFRVVNGSSIYGKLEDVTLDCGSVGFKLLDDFSLKNEVYSMLLAVVLSGKKVELYQTDSCDSSGRTIVNGVRIVD